MKKTTIVFIILIVIGLGAYVALYGGSYNKKIDTSVASPQAANNQGAIVSLKNFSFNPPMLTVKIGATVTWTNDDVVAHTITSDADDLLNSQVLSPGQSFSFTFIGPGSVDYHCNIHQAMKGQIIISD